ncbi:MAG TPA: hypothetical protein VFN42_00120, partial [Acetobacteraceae bacterium]|nr:hypothetical protein [Acetobacteraceae bacterium]
FAGSSGAGPQRPCRRTVRGGHHPEGSVILTQQLRGTVVRSRGGWPGRASGSLMDLLPGLTERPSKALPSDAMIIAGLEDDTARFGARGIGGKVGARI